MAAQPPAGRNAVEEVLQRAPPRDLSPPQLVVMGSRAQEVADEVTEELKLQPEQVRVFTAQDLQNPARFCGDFALLCYHNNLAALIFAPNEEDLQAHQEKTVGQAPDFQFFKFINRMELEVPHYIQFNEDVLPLDDAAPVVYRRIASLQDIQMRRTPVLAKLDPIEYSVLGMIGVFRRGLKLLYKGAHAWTMQAGHNILGWNEGGCLAVKCRNR